MNVLLTGATGFLGRYVLPALLAHGHTVVATLRAGSDASRFPEGVRCADMERDSLEAILSEHDVDAIIHLACQQGRGDVTAPMLIEANLLLGIRLLEAAKSCSVSFFLNADTMLEADVNAYALSKKQFSQWLPHYSGALAIANLRLGNIFGPGEPASGFLPWLLGEFDRGAPDVELTPGEQKRDFVHAGDVADAMVFVLEQEHGTGVAEYDVGSGELISLRSFVEAVAEEYAGQNKGLQSQLCFGALPYRPGETMLPRFATHRLHALGWRPAMTTRERLRETISAHLESRAAHLSKS